MNYPKFIPVLAVTFFCLAVLSQSPLKAQVSMLNGEKSSWHDGFDRYDFIMNEKTFEIKPYKAPADEGFGVKDPPAGFLRCIVVAPKQPAPGHPWSWRGCYWNVEPQTEIQLLQHGFYVAYISAGATLPPGKAWDAWYAFLTEKCGVSAKPAFIGMSRGGQFAYRWATHHPDKVSCIYADNPAADRDILMHLGDLAKYNVPLLHVCGSMDGLYGISTLPIEKIYQQFGGRISVMIKEGFGHHPHSLVDPSPIVKFITSSVKTKEKEKEEEQMTPAFAGRRPASTWFYATSDHYSYDTKEGTYMTTRGAFFNPCYHQYQVIIPGMEAFITIVAPLKEAPGKPWVFRPDLIRPDASVDAALLAEGFYIVKGAVPYNYDGPVLAEWNKIYQYLTGFGFSDRPVMEGDGGAAGEAMAWAIENPDKVACIYLSNPILGSKVMTKPAPIDHLQPLAKAGVPVFFECGSLDPSLSSQALVAQKRYQEMGGKITVQIRPGQGHYLAHPDTKAVLAFIGKHIR